MILKIVITLSLLFSFSLNGQTIDWFKGFNAGDCDIKEHLTLDNSFHYFIGTFVGTYDFDFGPNVNNLSNSYSGTKDLFVLKTDIDGNFIWVKSIQSNTISDIKVKDIAVDNNGEISFTFGGDGNGIDLDPGTGVVSPGGSFNSFLVHLSENGDYQWHKVLGYSSSFSPVVAVNSVGEIIVATSENGFPYSITQSSIRKYNNTGSQLWEYVITGTTSGNLSSTFIDCIKIDNNDNIITTGNFDGLVDFKDGPGTYNLQAGNTADIFLLKLNGDGLFLFAKQQDDLNDSGWLSGLTTDQNNNIYSIGQRAFSQLSQNTKGFFVKKMNSNGFTIWSKEFWSSNTNSINNNVSDVEVDGVGNVYICGKWATDSLDFNPGIGENYMYNPNGSSDFFVKLNSNGEYILSNTIKNISSQTLIHTREIMSMSISLQGKMYFSTDAENHAFIKLDQGICGNLAISVNSIQELQCSQLGGISLSGVGGTSPYTYLWSPSNTINSQVVVNSPGQQTITVEDLMGCSTATTFLMNGPTSQNEYDLTSNLITTYFRPGLSTNIWLDAFNSGCQEQSGQLKLILDNSVSFNYGWPAPFYANQDTIIWNFNDLHYDSLHITPYINVTTDTSAVIGDSVHFFLEVTPISNDFNPTNNTRNYVFPVVNGYDPNDKKVYPIGECTPGYVTNDQTLTYTVRFQNTGNSEAINISVIDTLNDALDINSLKVLASSHDMYTEIESGNVAKFVFDNIHLSDSLSNEIESHGYVVFSIDFKPNLLHNTEITNNVGIYFDFNPVVLTNETKNTIFVGDLSTWECYLGEEILEADFFKIYPNPTNDIIHVSSKENVDATVYLYDIHGNLIKTKVFKENKKMTLTIPSYVSGILFLRIESIDYSNVIKIMKI